MAIICKTAAVFEKNMKTIQALSIKKVIPFFKFLLFNINNLTTNLILTYVLKSFEITKHNHELTNLSGLRLFASSFPLFSPSVSFLSVLWLLGVAFSLPLTPVHRDTCFQLSNQPAQYKGLAHKFPQIAQSHSCFLLCFFFFFFKNLLPAALHCFRLLFTSDLLC